MSVSRRRGGWLAALTLTLTILAAALAPSASAAPRTPSHPGGLRGLADAPNDPLGCHTEAAACGRPRTFRTINNGGRLETYRYQLAIQLRGDPPHQQVRAAFAVDAYEVEGDLRVCQGRKTIRSFRELRDRCVTTTPFSRDASQFRVPILGFLHDVAPCGGSTPYFAVVTFRLAGSPGSGLLVSNHGQLPTAALGEITDRLSPRRCPS